MAALAANASLYGTLAGAPLITMPNMRVNAADEFYVGAVLAYDLATGQVDATPDSADPVAGVCGERTTTTGANDPVLVHIDGVFLFANTSFTIANGGAFFQATAASDNPADLVVTTGAGFTLAAGPLIQARTTAVDGWIRIAGRMFE